MTVTPATTTTTQLHLATPAPSHPYEGMALGLVSAQSFPAVVGIADMMLKSAGVHLVGYEKTGSGYCTAVVRGDIASVRLAVQAGIEAAETFGQHVSSLVLPRPSADLERVLPISPTMAVLARLGTPDPENGQAVGLLETRGFPALVGAADAMLKAADVHLVGYDQTGGGLCTVIIRGRVADVTIAIDAGMEAANRIGELHAIMVIPRPLEDLVHTLPQKSDALQESPPLRLPLVMPQREAAWVDVVAQEG